MKTRISIVLLLLAFSLEGRLNIFTKKPERAVDPAQSVKLTSRIPCDGASSPEDHPVVKVTFSPGGWERLFTINEFKKGTCRVDAKVKCLDKEVEGWYDSWTVSSKAPPLKADQVSLRSCYAWGSSEPAQYVLSGWYQEGPPDPKHPHKKGALKQTALKKVSSNPDVYEFTDPQGGTGRLEMSVR